MLPSTRKAAVAALVVWATSSLVPTEATGATADVFAKGRTYCASTHPNHGTIAGFGAAIDINGKHDDYGWPVYAPGEGRARIHSDGGGFGKSIIWTSANGRERIHMAHLLSFGRTGRVRAGDQIGQVGSTGHSFGSHLHAAASVGGRPAALVLRGEVIRPGRCYTSRGPKPPRCLGRDATVVGTRGRDRLVGSRADDVFVARGGRDVVKGRSGRDTACGGPGTDTLVGGRAGDNLSGGGTDDALRGGPGDDRLGGARGPDLLSAGPGRDRLEASAGRDRLIGHRGSDRLLGGPDGDALEGATGRDLLTGGRGKDVLKGGEDGDELEGNEDADRLAGGGGVDGVDGGGGDDVVDGGTGPDTLVGGVGFDLVSYAGSASPVDASLEQKRATTPGATDSLDGFEALRGSQLADSLTGDAGGNSIYGEGGDDTLDGLGGDNHLDGGAGFDTCLNGGTNAGCEA